MPTVEFLWYSPFLDFIDAVDLVWEQGNIMGMLNRPVAAETKNAWKERSAL